MRRLPKLPSARALAATALMAVLALAFSSTGLAQEKNRGKKAAAEAKAAWLTHPDLAQAQARKSGKPILVVTCWKSGICHSCDTWRSRVPVDDAVKKQLVGFELVQWNYDGLGGKVISWTKEHGGESDDPNVQAFVLDFDGRVRSRADERSVFTPAQFGRWLKKQSAAYGKDYPKTRLQLTRAVVELATDTDDTTAASRATCAALETARQSGAPVLVYVGHGPATAGTPSRATKAEIKACVRFENDALNSKQAHVAAKKWTLLRIDRSRPADAALAKSLGVARAPAIVLLPAPTKAAQGKRTPVLLDGKTTGLSLAHQLKKLVE